MKSLILFSVVALFSMTSTVFAQPGGARYIHFACKSKSTQKKFVFIPGKINTYEGDLAMADSISSEDWEIQDSSTVYNYTMPTSGKTASVYTMSSGLLLAVPWELTDFENRRVSRGEVAFVKDITPQFSGDRKYAVLELFDCRLTFPKK
ncbi:MAG: hypothetical protein AB7I27_15160 [Bacteriovoracaceae bacterium]